MANVKMQIKQENNNAVKKWLNKGFIFAFCLSLSTFCLMPQAASAHRYHTSLTRIDYNAKQKIYEISIQLFTHDLMPLLERKSGKRTELDKLKEADKIILNYLNENFILTDKKGATKTLKWVGRESDVDSVWIYLETEATENLEGFNLKNTIFFESFPEQVNLVVCRYDGKKADLMFKVGDKVKGISENKPAAEN